MDIELKKKGKPAKQLMLKLNKKTVLLVFLKLWKRKIHITPRKMKEKQQ